MVISLLCLEGSLSSPFLTRDWMERYFGELNRSIGCVGLVSLWPFLIRESREGLKPAQGHSVPGTIWTLKG